MNNRLLKSLMISLVLIWIVFYATEGVAKAPWASSTLKKYRMGLFTMILFMVGLSIYLILAPYQLFGPSPSDGYHSLLVTAHISYLILGCGLNLFSELEEKKVTAH
ncbi:hypothetical protein [Aquirufa sp. OSTEICH-129A]